jgi:hypothetical protein
MESDNTVNGVGMIDYTLCTKIEMEPITGSEKQTCVKVINALHNG